MEQPRTTDEITRNVQDYYNTWAKGYFRRYLKNARLNAELEVLYLWLNKNKPWTSAVFLDLGTGNWRPGALLQRWGRTIGVDLSPAMIQECHKRRPDLEVAVMDGRFLGFQEAAFDAVVSIGLFEYVDALGPFLVEIERVLGAGGWFCFTCWNRTRVRPRPNQQPFPRASHNVFELYEELRHKGFWIVEFELLLEEQELFIFAKKYKS